MTALDPIDVMCALLFTAAFALGSLAGLVVDFERCDDDCARCRAARRGAR